MAVETLVIGSTETIGGLVVAELVKRGVEVQVLVRSEDRAAHQPASVERQVGDLADPDAVRKALDGVRLVFGGFTAGGRLVPAVRGAPGIEAR